jgi:type IV pilus assembly protein PilA
MLHKLRSRAANQDGFTLIELLVVILIIGILAAIALPTFLGQRSKGQDASAKSDARNLVSQVESCYATEQTYVNCDSNNELSGGGTEPTGLDYGTGQGQVEVLGGGSAATSNSYTVVGHSKSGNNFTIAKAAAGSITRSCTTTSKGACPASGSW